MAKNKTARELAENEQIFCVDCIYEALAYAGLSPYFHGVGTRVPRDKKMSFLAALLLGNLRSHPKEGL